MNISELEYELNKDNKFYWLLSATGSTSVNKSFFKLLKSTIDLYKDDIDKPIYKIGYDYNNESVPVWKVSLETPASILFDLHYSNECNWTTDYPAQMLDFLKENGLDFTKQDKIYFFKRKPTVDKIEELDGILNFPDSLRIIESKAIHSIDNCKFLDLSYGYSDDKRVPTFIKLFSEQLSREDFLNLVKDTELLHKAVRTNHSHTVNLLINELGIDVNLLDSKGRTPFMLTRSSGMADLFLEKDELELFIKNKDGKDCLYLFGMLSDKQESKELMAKTQAAINKRTAGNKDFSKGLLESNKQTLLALVESQKNKKEIEDFIKRSKVEDIEDIVDSKGRSLTQISIIQDSWAKIPLFIDKYPKSHRDKFGYSNLEYALFKPGVKMPNLALKAIKSLLLEAEDDTGINLIKRFFRQDRPFSAPKWFLTNDTTKAFIDTFCGKNERSPDEIQEYRDLVRHNPDFTSTFGIDESRINLMKNLIEPYFIHAFNSNKIEEINNLDLNKVCYLKDTGNRIDPQISTNLLSNMLVIKVLSKEMGFSIEQLTRRFEDHCIDFLQTSYKSMNENKDNNLKYFYDSYIGDTKHVIETLLEFDSKRLNECVTPGFLSELAEQVGDSSDIIKRIEASLLNMELSSKEEVKVKKMKI